MKDKIEYKEKLLNLSEEIHELCPYITEEILNLIDEYLQTKRLIELSTAGLR